MGVRVKRLLDARVAQMVADCNDRYALVDEQRSAGMTNIVNPDCFYTCSGGTSLKNAGNGGGGQRLVAAEYEGACVIYDVLIRYQLFAEKTGEIYSAVASYIQPTK